MLIYLSDIKNNNSVAIHIRRGTISVINLQIDFMEYPINYYENAIKILESKYRN